MFCYFSFSQVIGVFDCAGLPEYTRASWHNAGVLCHRGFVQPHNTSKPYYMVNSLSSTAVYDVNMENWHCRCERFTAIKICAHILAVAFVSGRLGRFLQHWEEPKIESMLVPYRQAGKKPGKPRSRPPPSKRTPFDRTKFTSTIAHQPPDEKEFSFVWLADNPLVKICVGCTGTVRPPKAVPHAPLDLVVRTKMYRSFHGAGGAIRFQLEKKPAYFHLRCSREL